MSSPERPTPLVVAIDGAAGSGKSTLARALAGSLGLPYVNTGLMYRALARAALDSEVDLDDERSLTELTRGLRVRLASTSPAELEVDGYPADVLHTVEVDAAVSRVSRHPSVRALLRDAQRALAEGGAVMEGRDIGTVVCPEAPVKLFLRADDDQRGTRRSRERGDDGISVAAALHERDSTDARVNPLEPAADAVTVDTSHATPADTLALALEIVRTRR